MTAEIAICVVGVGGDDQGRDDDEHCGFHYGDYKDDARRESDDALPFTKCGLCEEGGKHDGSKFSLRPVRNESFRLRFVRWCEKIADERESLRLLFSRRMSSTPHLKQLPRQWRTRCISFCVSATAENILRPFENFTRERLVIIGSVAPTLKIFGFRQKMGKDTMPW